MSKKSDKEWRDDDTVAKVLKNTTFGPWPDAKITQETMEHFGVRVKYSEKLGPDFGPVAIYFPTYDSEYKRIIGFQKKDLTIDKNEKYHFTNIGTVNVKNPMFFQNMADTRANHIYISEGPKDALSWYQAVWDNTEKEWRDRIPPVVSILLGTPNAVKNIKSNEEFIDNYKGLYIQKGEKKRKGPVLMFDDDYSEHGENECKGREATEEVAAFLKDHYVKVLKHLSYVNDCADYLKKGKAKELYENSIFKTEEYKPESVVRLYDKFEPGELFKPIDKGTYLKCFPMLMDKLLGIRMNELTLILGDSGSGKSSVAFDIGFQFNENEDGSGNDAMGGMFIEDSLMKTNKRAIARKMRIHPNVYKFEPPPYNEDVERWVNDNFILLNHFGSIPIERLVGLTKLFIHKYNRKIIILDHISLVISGSKIEDERKALDRAMTELAALCEQYPIHLFIVCHINRNASSDRKRDIKEPIWKRVFSTDARGSSGLEGLSSNIICVDTEILPSGSRGRIRLNLTKNREADKIGMCDTIVMDKTTGEFVDAKDWVYDEAKGVVVPGSNISY